LHWVVDAVRRGRNAASVKRMAPHVAATVPPPLPPPPPSVEDIAYDFVGFISSFFLLFFIFFKFLPRILFSLFFSFSVFLDVYFCQFSGAFLQNIMWINVLVFLCCCFIPQVLGSFSSKRSPSVYSYRAPTGAEFPPIPLLVKLDYFSIVFIFFSYFVTRYRILYRSSSVPCGPNRFVVWLSMPSLQDLKGNAQARITLLNYIFGSVSLFCFLKKM
jgi:hypothetical protein